MRARDEKKLNKRVKVVSQFLEEFAREMEKETIRFPVLSIPKKSKNSWIGFRGHAELLVEELFNGESG